MAEAHVLVFPCPVQGHINSMLPFAAALLDAGVFVTFLHTDHNLRRATSVADSPRLRFLSIPDGLPADHPRSVGDIMELERSMREVGAVSYRVLLASLLSSAGAGRPGQEGDSDDDSFPPVTCVAADGLLTFAIDAAEELGLPAIAFRTSSASSFLAYRTVPKLVLSSSAIRSAAFREWRASFGAGTFQECSASAAAVAVHSRGTEGDLLHVLAEATAHSREARALVFNTAASLEGPALAHIAPRMRDVFAVGPLHAMPSRSRAQASSLWSEDDGCMAWLDSQADRSVVYVSLGSLAVISHEQFAELVAGLVAAGYPFLWVLRPDMVEASRDATLQETAAAAGGDDGKARVVAWAPQRDVLRHRAVGCFLTHAGWNSTLEAVAEGVPMVCWPSFGDQLINSRLVGAVWGNGLDMKDVCERDIVERMVREAMESDAIRGSAQALARMVRRDVGDGGSSAREFQRLVRFIKDLSMEDDKSNHQN
ncbi:unnamed protein product [Urochloa humidicola]